MSGDSNEKWLIVVEYYLNHYLKTDDSRRSMITAINDIAEVISGGEHRDYTKLTLDVLNPSTFSRVVDRRQWSSRQRPKIATAFRRLAKVAVFFEFLDANLESKIREVETNRRSQKPRIKKRTMVSDEEFTRLIEVCLADESPSGIRDATMIAIGGQTGLRKQEIGKIKLPVPGSRKESDNENIFAHRWLEDKSGNKRKVIDLTVCGKGNKVRNVVFAGYGMDLFDQWLEIRGTEILGPVFCPIRKGGTISPGKGLSPTALHNIFHRRLLEAGLRPCGWHDLRRRYGSQLFLNGKDPLVVRDLLGHSSVDTTVLYDVRPQTEREEAALSIDTPRPGAY